MKGLTDFLPINEISTAFYFLDFRLQARSAMAAKCIVKILLINNLGLKDLMVNFGIKHTFKYEKNS